MSLKKKTNQQLTVRKEMREGALSRPGMPSVQAAAGFSTPLLRVSAQLWPRRGPPRPPVWTAASLHTPSSQSLSPCLSFTSPSPLHPIALSPCHWVWYRLSRGQGPLGHSGIDSTAPDQCPSYIKYLLKVCRMNDWKFWFNLKQDDPEISSPCQK